MAERELDWVKILRGMAEDYAELVGAVDRLAEALHEVAEDYDQPELERLFQAGPLRARLVLLAGGTLVDSYVLEHERREEAERKRRM